MVLSMAEAGFEEIGTYITRRQNMVAQYIVTRPILDLCEQSARRPVAWLSRPWWYQERLELEGAEERSVAESDEEEAQSEEEGRAQEEMTGR